MPRLFVLLLTLLAVDAGAIELARVNGEIITDADMKSAFVGKHGGHTVFLGGDAEARRFLDIVINERLLVQEAYALGLDADPAVKPQIDELRDRLAATHLLRREIDGKATPTKEEIRAAWELADVLFLAREIVVDTKSEAEEMRRAILSGADFQIMARSCSVAPTRTKGGSIAPFTWGSMPVEIENAVSALQPGELSAVFHDGDGWAVLYLDDRVEAYRPVLDEKISNRIAAKLIERKKASLTQPLSASLWRKYDANVVLDDYAPATLARLVRTSPDTVVATWKGGQLTAKQALTDGELRMYTSFPPGRGAEKVKSTLESAINTALIRLEARAQKFGEEPSVVAAVQKQEVHLMEGVLYAKHVLTGVKVDEAEVRESYERQKSSLILSEKRRVAHIAVASEAEAKDLLGRIRKGEDFLELLKKHTLDAPGIKQEGDLGWIEKGKVAEIYDPLFALPVGGVAEPIKSEKAWHLVRVTAIEPAHPLSYDEAKEKLRTTLLEKKKHDAREYWIEKLRAAGEIEIFEKGVKAFVAANPYEEPKK